jgi:hypothetical protein
MMGIHPIWSAIRGIESVNVVFDILCDTAPARAGHTNHENFLGNIEIYQSWYDDSKLREEIQDDGSFIPFPAHIDPTGSTNQLQKTVPRA